MKRREFVQVSGSFVVLAGMGTSACGSNPDVAREEDLPPEGTYRFPQGVASGDPRDDSVMLWTRVEGGESAKDPIDLVVEVAEDEKFEKIVADADVVAEPAHDHTVRVVVEKLKAGHAYFYRFRAGQDLSRTGRTRTAPSDGDDVPVRLAWASCQEYEAGFYGAWRRMIEDDEKKGESERIQLVLHVGDFIYETRGEDWQAPIDENLEEVKLVDRKGKERKVPAFPSDKKRMFAKDVSDYRHLYRTFLADPDLQEARARWPFICTWDDHEFSDDCWQSQANYSRLKGADEPSQQRRVAASQAWFEYIPAFLSGARGVKGVEPRAADFAPAKVENTPFEKVDGENRIIDENNEKAIGAITVYRSLRFGKHVEIVLTDCRSYRSDHALREDDTTHDPFIFHPRAALPLDAVLAFDAGKTADGGNPPDELDGFDNARKASPPGTMLGKDQREWLMDTLKGSDATWKIWGSSVPVLRIRLDTTTVRTALKKDLVLSADGWDGYPSERNEILGFLRKEKIANVVSLSGDHHAHIAGVLHDDYDSTDSAPVAFDLATAGISSNSQFAAVAGVLKTLSAPATIARLITYDSTLHGGKAKVVPNMNALIRWGSPAADEAAQTNDLDEAEAKADPKVNPHLTYVDTDAYGYGLAEVSGDGMVATLVTIEKSLEDLEGGAKIKGTATFRISKWSPGGGPEPVEPVLTGKKPFPFEKV